MLSIMKRVIVVKLGLTEASEKGLIHKATTSGP